MKNSFIGLIHTGDILYLNDDQYLDFLAKHEGREVMVTIQPIQLPFTDETANDSETENKSVRTVDTPPALKVDWK